MVIVNVPTDSITDKEGSLTQPWRNYFDQSTQQMQQSLGQEGIWVPSVSPPTSGGQLAQVAASFGTQGGINAGTIVFDPAEVNGGSAGAPNGQLKVILADGLFHKITNS